MELSIIIVNWDSIDFTRECLASIGTNVRGLEYEVIVVDNASRDDIGVLCSEMLPSLKLVRSCENLGFAGANNLGVEHSCGEKLLFLNPDTLVLEDAVQKLVSALDSDPELGVVGCRLLNRDYSLQASCVQPFPTIMNQLLTLDWIQKQWPRWSLLGIRSLFDNPDGLSGVEVVSGACLMVRRDIFERLGGFSTDYFLYAEEADLCRRIPSAGWKVCHVGNAQVVHFGGESSKSNGSTFSDVVMHESVFKLLRKFRGAAYAYLYRAALLLSAAVRLGVLAPLLFLPSSMTDRGAVLRAFRKWRSIARWGLALEGWSHNLGKRASPIPPRRLLLKNTTAVKARALSANACKDAPSSETV
jgi:GT2 family glycosyltransferase